MQFYPYEKKGVGGAVAMLKGGGTKSVGVVFMWQLKVLAILKGGPKGFHSLKGWGCVKSFTLSWGGGAKGGGARKVSDPLFSHFLVPPPPPPN